jgi:hypothetical protein
MRMKSTLAKGFAALGLAAGVFATTAVVHSQSRSRITPYLEVQQVLNADLNDGDVLTYTSVGAGVDGSIQTRRVQATISYNYQRRIAWEGNLNDDDVHSGLAALQVKVAPGVTFDAGALAVRSHGDIAVPVAGVQTSDDPNLVDVYSFYAGPTLSTRVGPVDVGASYRLGYVKIDDDGVLGGPTSGPRFDSYDHSLVQSAAVSAGAGPGKMAPFGWTVGAGYSREDSDRLDATNEALFVRGDVVLPVGHSVAVTGGVGYEEFSASQQDYLRDAAGLPVLSPGGELIADPSKPRLLSFDQSGMIWDVGVIWRPSRRTELQARVGRRYGGTTYTGSLEHRINENYAVTASVYDSVTTFGQLLILNLDNVPVSFKQARNGFGGGVGGVGGCVFGKDPTSGTCFDDALQSINGATFRNRGANIMLSGGRGPWSFNAGAGYVQRRYFAPPPSGTIFSRDDITDRSFTLQAGVSRDLTRRSGVSADAYAGWYDSGAAGTDASFSTGITGSYYRTLMQGRLQANVAAGLYNTQAGDYDSTVASILFGMRYRF